MRLQLDDPPMVEVEQCGFGILESGGELTVGIVADSGVVVSEQSRVFTQMKGRETANATTEVDALAVGGLVDFIASEGSSGAFIECPRVTSVTTSASTREIGMAPQFQNVFPILKVHDRARGEDPAPPPTLLTRHTSTNANPPTLVSKPSQQGGEAVVERCFSSPPQLDMHSACVRVGASRVSLDSMVSFGDILSIRSNDRLARIGASGGFMGHVLLITSKPMCVERHTPEALAFHRVWPHLDVTCIWRTPVIESTRSALGLNETTCLLYIDPKSGSITALGDMAIKDGGMEIGQFDDNTPGGVQLFRCPPELRKLADESLMRQALDDLKACDASWSWTTAVRAFLLEGEVTAQNESDDLIACKKILEDIQACWTSEPICTSVVIIFWQRYLCHLVEHVALPGVGNNARDAIFQYMPLKADRALPGELTAVLRSRSWETIARVPLEPKARPMARFNSL